VEEGRRETDGEKGLAWQFGWRRQSSWWVGDRSGPGNAAGLPGRREKMVMGFSFLGHAACLGFGPVIAHLTGPNWPRFKPGCE
jgi:hypothetical protein